MQTPYRFFVFDIDISALQVSQSAAPSRFDGGLRGGGELDPCISLFRQLLKLPIQLPNHRCIAPVFSNHTAQMQAATTTNQKRSRRGNFMPPIVPRGKKPRHS
jgi:hypothetical protein